MPSDVGLTRGMIHVNIDLTWCIIPTDTRKLHKYKPRGVNVIIKQRYLP